MFNIRSFLDKIFLYESLTKGSAGILANKSLVQQLAAAIRDDASANPRGFLIGNDQTDEKDLQMIRGNKIKGLKPADDKTLVEWFLGILDGIEKEGYNDVQYSRDGANNMWVVLRYIAGAHNLEDLKGTLAMNLSKFFWLKTPRPDPTGQDANPIILLKPQHRDLQKFNSIRDLGQVLVFHYAEVTKAYEEAMIAKKMKKSIRGIKLVDNDDYIITITLNKAANITWGLGTTWCTASSTSHNYFPTYSSRCFLYQVNLKKGDYQKLNRAGRAIEGNERYQFDYGSNSFKDIADNDAPRDYIKQKLPYLYTDIKRALETNQESIQKMIDDLYNDEKLMKDESSKLFRHYNVTEEITGLTDFANRSGYFTARDRETDKSAQDNQEIPPPEND